MLVEVELQYVEIYRNKMYDLLKGSARVLNKDKQMGARQIVTSLFFIGSFISPIFGRFFRSSLDFKYFYALVGKWADFH